MTDFVHLRAHTSYSLAKSAIKINDLVKKTTIAKMPAIATTDTGNLFGSLEFAKATLSSGIKPIIGCEMAVKFAIHEETHISNLPKLVFYAKNENGYKNLLKLVSDSFIKFDAKYPYTNLAEITQYSEDLLVLTGGTGGIINRLLHDGLADKAEETLLQLKQIFGPEDLFIEINRDNDEISHKIEDQLLDVAYKLDLPIVATNHLYFLEKEMFEAHDALTCIAEGRYISESDRPKSHPELYFKSTAQMQELFKDLPEAIENTILIARKCSYAPEERAPMLPKYPIDTGISEAAELTNQAKQGLSARLENFVFQADWDDLKKKETTEQYFTRLEFELSVIMKMDFPGYFLIVSDFIKWSKANNIPVGPGRGSGAGSVVAWSLEITDLDPIRFGLLFERFLNPERISMPDFDIDFCQERRDEVIRYVRDRYGSERVAHILTLGTMQARAVIKDVGRVMSLAYGQVDRISKMVPFNPVNPVNLSQAIAMEPSLQNARKEDPQIAKLLDIALSLEGLHRHSSTHAAGIVIADQDLVNLVPLTIDDETKMYVVQYSMKYCEASGLIKFDFLGLKTLTLIANTLKLLAKRGINFSIASIPLDDKKTYEMLTSGLSVGVFQFESVGMRDSLRKLRPDCIEDLIALGALYRPGPMDNIPTYIARKHGLEEPDYMHPMLEDVLKETFGVIIYQEQVMEIAKILGGYSLGAADLLRRAMGKKIKEEMEAQARMFIDGCIKNGLKEEQARLIFDLVAKFAGYGFNKSHAAAYAMISYQTAYLKANYKVEFLTASLNLEINDTDKVFIFLSEARALGIKILPPDINKSSAYFNVEYIESDSDIEPESCIDKNEMGAKDHLRAEISSMPLSELNQTSNLKAMASECTNEYMIEPESCKIAKDHLRAEIGIRYGLGALKSLGIHVIEKFTQAREEFGTIDSMDKFIECASNCGFNRRQIENLIKAGAFDNIDLIPTPKLNQTNVLRPRAKECTQKYMTELECHKNMKYHLRMGIGINRAMLFGAVSDVIRGFDSIQDANTSNQFSLFGHIKSEKFSLSLNQNIVNWGFMESINAEYEAFGFYLNRHPLDNIQEYLARSQITFAANLENLTNGFHSVKMACVLTQSKAKVSPKGRYLYCSFSDPTGVFDASIFDENILAAREQYLGASIPVILYGDVRKDDGGVRITVNKMQALDEFLHYNLQEVHIHLSNTNDAYLIKDKMINIGPNGVMVKLYVPVENKSVEISLGNNFMFNFISINQLALVPSINKIDLFNTISQVKLDKRFDEECEKTYTFVRENR